MNLLNTGKVVFKAKDDFYAVLVEEIEGHFYVFAFEVPAYMGEEQLKTSYVELYHAAKRAFAQLLANGTATEVNFKVERVIKTEVSAAEKVEEKLTEGQDEKPPEKPSLLGPPSGGDDPLFQ